MITTADKFFQEILNYLSHLFPSLVWIIFLIENAMIVVFVLLIGRWLQKLFAPKAPAYSYSSREWFLCSISIILNTVVTYTGFWLWKESIMKFQITSSIYMLVDFIILFFAMDFLMYVFHFMVHKTALYKLIHRLHHHATKPKPIDLFIVHPLEALCFGSMWLSLLMIYPFNFYSIFIYLTLNTISGMIGHLGLEPLPERLHNNTFIKLLGTSTFHHGHHQDLNHNFGFYTTIWDRLFGTLKK